MEHVEETQSYTEEEDNVETSRYVSTIPVVPQLSVALGLLVAVFGVTYIGVATTLTRTDIEEDVVHVETVVEAPESQEKRPDKSLFNNIALEAKSAFVWDVQNQRVLFNKSADVPLPLASVTKLMTALVSSELLPPDETVAISLDAILTEGDSGMIAGEEFRARDLTDLVLMTSSNDAAVALSAAAGNVIFPDQDPEEVFVTAMNIKAEELGLTRTEFHNSTGLDLSETKAGAYGSARDMAHLMAYIINNATDAVALTATDQTKIHNLEGAYHLAQNTNSIVSDIDGLIASKTGYTELAGGNLVIAFNAGLNRPIVVAVLGSSYQGRFEDTRTLVEKTREYIANE